MICPNCRNPVDDNAIACEYCGARFTGPLTAGETTVLDASGMQGFESAAYASSQYSRYQAPVDNRPAIQLPTERAWWKMLLLGLVTFGIYPLVIYSKIITELNIAASRYDGERTMSYFGMVYLAPVTLGIYPIVWMHTLSNRIGAEVSRRGYDYKFSASDFWLWNVLGSLILVGPFVYMHKLLKSMNIINDDFNQNG